MKVKLRRQTLLVLALREVVFSRLTGMTEATGRMDPETGEGARLVDEDGNRTLEEVTFYPPDRITFRHLEGPLYFSQEQFTLSDSESGTALTHEGEIECRMPGFPALDGWWLGSTFGGATSGQCGGI